MPSWTTETADVVVFGMVPWTSRWQRPHHLAQELVRRGHRVVYVSPHLLTGRQRWRELEEPSQPEGVVLAQLSTFDLESVHSEEGWTENDVAHAHHTFWSLVNELRLRCPVLFVQSPGWWPLLEWIHERTEFPLVYDCIDEHTGWNRDTAEGVRAAEEELARAADLVLASAAPLAERLREHADDVVLVPNGCDFDHFATAAEPNGVLRPPFDGPIVGYFGAISAGWFDSSLLVTLAESRPDWNFVLVGPADDETRALLDPSPNVVQLGTVSYAELPRYCADFDVATIPFLVNELTRATDPVKLYEYFATGKPVVTTPLPEIYEHQGPLVIADTPAAFERAIEAFLRDPGDRDRRREIARGASWDKRVDLFYDRLLACLPSLDVVVLTHNGAALTQRCLASLAEDRSYPHHLIVVDNASTDATPSLLEDLELLEHTTVVRNETNIGFSPGLNQGVQAGTGRYVLVLNNDTELPRGVLLAFVNGLLRSRNTGLLGPVTNSIGNEAEIYAPYRPGHKDELDAWFAGLAFSRFGWRFEFDSPALFAAIVRREDFEAVGGLSDRYQVGMFEDDELAERMRRYGKQALGAEDIFVHHAGGAAFRTLDPVVYAAIFDRNRRVFESAVGRPWKPHRARTDKNNALPPPGSEDERASVEPSPPQPRRQVPTPELSYFICGTGRSGTTLLCELLKSTRVAGVPDEHFSIEVEQGRQTMPGRPEIRAHIEDVLTRGTTPNGVFGTKIMWGWFAAFLDDMRTISQDPDVSDVDLLRSRFPNARFVSIWRQDVVAQAVSWAKARQTDQWLASHTIRGGHEFDFDEIHKCVSWVVGDRLRWERWFEREAIVPLKVTYEELVADQVAVTKAVLEYLGVDLPPNTVIQAPRMKRQADEVNTAWIERYKLLAAQAPSAGAEIS